MQAVQGFLDQNAAVLGDVATNGAKQKLDQVQQTLAANSDTQAANAVAARTATQTRTGLRKALVDEHMRRIARIAAAELPNFAELAPLPMPPVNVSDEALASKARAMATAATNYSATLHRFNRWRRRNGHGESSPWPFSLLLRK